MRSSLARVGSITVAALLGLAPFACKRHRAVRRSTPAASSSASASHALLSAPPYDVVEFTSDGLALQGLLSHPPGAGPFPAVVFNHGSERDPGTKPGIATWWLDHGYVFFMPYRRGHAGPSAKSAGVYFDDVSTPDRPTSVAQILAEQVDDVAAAIAVLKKDRAVDSSRVVVAGCSFGGIETMLVSARDLGLRAAIDFSGGAQSWAGNAPLRQEMLAAAREAKIPVLFVQAENDYDLTPSRVLSQTMLDAGKVAEVAFFPAFGGPTPADGHSFCTGRGSGQWGRRVARFLDGH